jgi:hypothetical protein
MIKYLFVFPLLLVLSNQLVSQKTQNIKLNWETISDNNNLVLIFKESSIKSPIQLPVYYHFVSIANNEKIAASIVVTSERILTSKELSATNILRQNFEKDKINLKVNYTLERKKNKKGVIHFNPIYKKGGQLYLIESFDISYSVTDNNDNNYSRSGSSFKSLSVLASGDIFKLGIIKDGVYKITYTFLEEKGIITGSTNSNQLNIYGNHNGMLPENNSDFRYDDLEKNSIYIEDGSDGVFEQGDYILFYAQSPNKWKYNTASGLFYYEKNLYTDTSFYFLKTNDNSGAKRIQDNVSSTASVTSTMTSFNDYLAREDELYNIMEENNRGGSGKQWYGNLFDVQLTYNYNFAFPNLDQTSSVNVKTALLGYSPGTSPSYFSINIGGMASDNLSIPGIPFGSHTSLGIEQQSNLNFTSNTNNIPVSITYTKASNGNSQGWLDYIEVNAKRNISMYGNQMDFRDVSTVGSGNITQFNLSSATSVYKIWEITDPINVNNSVFNDNSTTKNFIFESDSLRDFISFTNSNYLTPFYKGKIANQNLHGQPVTDMIIVYHPNFKEEVTDLENFHVSRGLTVVKATVQEIYNEFSSGSQDVSAIKTYAKMLYEKGGVTPPKYLLLFGDGSFDYKKRTNPDLNFVPVWESVASLNDLGSYTSDDFFAILDDGEGMGNYDAMDIAVGRLPATSKGTARILVDKIKNYQKQGVSLTQNEIESCNEASSGNSFGDWRNILAFVTDDVDDSWEISFLNHAEKTLDSIAKNYPIFNVDKLYMDAFKQESTPGGERYFEGAEAIRRRVENGALIVTYEGHGGEVGWAHERILDLATINNWTNYNRLPVFLTATCEFTKYDDPSRVSAGEQTILNPQGGCIALFTTTRAVFQSANERLIEAFFKEAFIKEVDGTPRTLGEIYLETKNHPLVIGNSNSRKFGLIGDPALDLAFPKHQVITKTINNVLATGATDTLKALSKVTITGFVADQSGNILPNYNGYVFPTVYDKEKTFSTLGNLSTAYIKNFQIQNSILYKGKATVTNGTFSFTFIVPKDINYQYGYGKISYYAFDGNEDAAGYFSEAIVGGTNNKAGLDEIGPDISVYLNNKNFVSGGITDENPSLYAEIFDSNGINTTGNGIGHDISAVIDENTNKAIVLNSYYESDADTYQSGKITYPFSTLSEGNHTLTLKAWDVYNNSSSSTIDFVVVKNEKLAIEHVLNYPNPFTTRTQFFFEHNQTCESLEVQIQVFTVSGKLVKTLNKIVTTHGYRVDPIEWDGKDDFGDNIGRGTYVYRVKVIDDEGNKVEKFEKLVILK